MKIPACVLLSAMILVATAASAQTGIPLLAFPRSGGASFGISSFGTRSTNSLGATFTYKGSLVISGRYDQPLSRRTGLLLGLGLAPLSQQRGKGGGSTVLGDRVMLAIAEAAIGWRFKPIAPVFFSLGGGITYATKPAANTATGAMKEPHALFAIGYDAPSSTGWNVRTVFTNRFVMVGNDSDLNTVKKSTAYDWTLEVGTRYRFGPRR